LIVHGAAQVGDDALPNPGNKVEPEERTDGDDDDDAEQNE